MWTGADRDHTLPALPLPGVVEDRNRTWRLHDAPIAAEVGQHGTDTALREASIFGSVVPVEAPGVVEGRRLASLPRHRPVLAAGARRIALLARLGRLQQRQPELALHPGARAGLLGQGRELAVGGIDD